MLMRNFDPKRGLVNNTKCVVTKLWSGGASSSGRSLHKAIEVALVIPDPDIPGAFCKSDETYVIPRIAFVFDVPRAKSLTIVRMQFPLTLCYAITAHKAQGQTLAKILVDQRNDSFAHGQTYVVFGRAQNRESVCVLTRPERGVQHDGQEHVLIRNVTYPNLLL